MAVAGLVLAGCGGAGVTPISQFSGTWTGNQSFLTNAGLQTDVGTLTFTVDVAGYISGSITRDPPDQETVPLSGNVLPGGELAFTWQFSNFSSARTANGMVEVVADQLRPKLDSNLNRRLRVRDANATPGYIEFALSK
ncbi:MAG: hypothetical protein IAE99_02485 [Rhodothermales bacterium]|nr:hypothetical protein [Rhodothermales bacterium]